MRPPKVTQEELLPTLQAVFRQQGYDGASLNELATAVGLQKASLYHRFPKGKTQIAEEVLVYTREQFESDVYEILVDKNSKPNKRLKDAIKNIRDIYDNGNSNCLFRSFSTETGLQLFGEQLHEGMQKWMKGFRKLAMDMGFSKEEAEEKALEVLVRIQGSLVVARVMDDPKVFKRELKSIRNSFSQDD